MALNPIAFTEKVVGSFLKYQLTAYAFADDRLHEQMRTLLSLEKTRNSPLLQGPYISLSRPFVRGAPVEQLVSEGIFHPHIRNRIPEALTHLYGHQEEAIRAISQGKTTIISTGTGSGKTECFLYPIVSNCFSLRDENAAPGISAVIVYPMNALAEDQLGRIRLLLAGTGIPFGMYIGKTPENESDVIGIRMPAGSSRADYVAKLDELRTQKRGETVYPPEEVCSREKMRTPGSQPRILLTNTKQLELLLTRRRDSELFAGARLDYLVFDEAHTYTGAVGAETACLIRRLRSFCGNDVDKTTCIATSATVVDIRNPESAREFASRFFGVPRDEVVTIGESHEEEVWAPERSVPDPPSVSPVELLNECVSAVEADNDSDGALSEAYQHLSGERLPKGDVSKSLHAALSRNELVFHLAGLLHEPKLLHDLVDELEERIGRPVSEEEILAWLTLGAAARIEERPLLRPVVHCFVRGISGAVVSFPESNEPRLWLAAEDEIDAREHEAQFAHFPVTTCTTCGQHYFVTHLKDFSFTGREPGGGSSADGSIFWEPLEEAQGGCRVVLTDRIVGGSDDEDIDAHTRTHRLHFCRHCGAAHKENEERCAHCGISGELVILNAIRQNENSQGYLSSCLSCVSTGRRFGGTRYREPARPVRATNVADVHVLSQDMIHHSERPRLLVFCDNRQDAAFQAGWMQDHARRFRLRALMAEGLQEEPISIGDLTHFIDNKLERDGVLSRALMPEVWNVARLEGSGGEHARQRKKFLRMQVLREITLSSRQSIGLEPWGRMKIEYLGLNDSLPWILEKANELGLHAERLRDGVASLLDYLRRKRVLHDPDYETFTKFWMDGDQEVQQGYLPKLGNPVGTKLHRTPEENADTRAQKQVAQWLSSRGDTTIRQIVRSWGVENEEMESFMEELFDLLRELEILVPVRLKGSRGRPLPIVENLYQIDADKIRLSPHRGFFRCRSCRRRIIRETPYSKCPAWRCEGDLEFVREDPENYDLQLLDQGYSMLRPEEHTAMVPHEERERLENLFKGESDAVNCFVCTPTLELGVDIGKLDAILMRNVPPLPANYWQRAGRAGRRHRMAVDFTYCRPVSHDRAYFADPIRLLAGRVDPPSFNMRNEVMVSKHAHASVITRLHHYLQQSERSEAERNHIREVLNDCLPSRVSHYLFNGGRIRANAFDLSPLRKLIDENLEDLVEYVHGAFSQGWPEDCRDVATKESLQVHVAGFVDSLDRVIGRLRGRLNWSMKQIVRLNRLRETEGVLEPFDEALFRRCDRLVKRLKGAMRRSRRQAEGYDDVNTFGMLAAEGFLPGYGLEVGSILGRAEIPWWRTGSMEFALPRPPSVALREYVPGNLIYANGNRFVARHFHRDLEEKGAETPVFEVSTERQAVKEIGLGSTGSCMGGMTLRAISVCDVDLVHRSHISDDEELRFQLGVSVYGVERDRHNGGTSYLWGEQQLQFRRGVHLRLINVGASSCIERRGELGYPVCTVCGQSVSPLSSQKQRDSFAEQHEEWCHSKVEPVGFYADVVADAISLTECENKTTACSVLEAIRFAATRVLDMHVEDLQILVIGYVDRDEVDALLWDPMPGGSGLLDQICERFEEVIDIAKEIVEDCPSACESSCIDCLQTFRNAFYHKYLNRTVASECFEKWGRTLQESHAIPPNQPATQPAGGSLPVNEAERRLMHLLLAAGFEEGTRNEQIFMDRVIGTTTPDVIYRAPHHGKDEGICIYLDGLSEHIHGNPETAARDRDIRSWLRNHGYDVIEIAVSDLADRNAMVRHFRKLANYLRKDELRDEIRDDQSWFEKEDAAPSGGSDAAIEIVEPEEDERFVTCVPLLPIEAAAGYFGAPERTRDDMQWVRLGSSRKLRPGMFVAMVAGHSMEPRIPDGSYCLFSSPVTGTRQGKVVLVELQDQMDPELGSRFTVKRYESEKVEADDGTWRHVQVTLHPRNRDFEPIEITCEEEGQVSVIAELVEVLA